MQSKTSWLVAVTLGLGVALLLAQQHPLLRQLSRRSGRWAVLEAACEAGPVLFEVGLWLLERSHPLYGRAARGVVDLARRSWR